MGHLTKVYFSVDTFYISFYDCLKGTGYFTGNITDYISI